MRGQFNGNGANEHPEPALRSGIGSVLDHRKILMDRGNVDDAATGALHNHLLGRGLRTEKRPREIDGRDQLPFLKQVVHESKFLLIAGIVYKDIELAKCRQGPLPTQYELQTICWQNASSKRSYGASCVQHQVSRTRIGLRLHFQYNW